MAGLSLQFKVIGIERLLKKLDKETIEAPLQKGIRNLTLLLERLVKTSTPVDTGRLRSSIASEVRPLYGKVGTIVEYAPFVEYGTRPHFPPVEPIEEWARRHGMRGMGFVIARAIARRGTRAEHMEGSVKVKGKGMFTYALERLREKLPNMLKGIGKDIEAKFED